MEELNWLMFEDRNINNDFKNNTDMKDLEAKDFKVEVLDMSKMNIHEYWGLDDTVETKVEGSTQNDKKEVDRTWWAS